MLEIAVHHGDEARLAGEDALEAGAGEAAPSDAADAADAGIAGGDLLGDLRSCIRRVVVDDDELPGDAGKSSLHGVDQMRNVVALVEGRNDDGELGRGLRL